ncbi:aminotransferase class I/II-fold pyridoxal phosphate-dependent enzyme [Neobacillus notoginsengisoli]|uniref:Aminotransferase class I/II-fold pyridoxal phosphate-dependent enzyme n=1 Tax=Neobacillus notoginsengisoli TaxID=1578198 RepID=A0A417YX82_9BACI|nr:LL-diaminopimelate aminotransferase [Neobacillus notoginsengisoli]RHW42171.1 aminotransferase class I/II-fold pyridoxal phosphate-dependent enzyme [Neobacillus notoginsengisoli]
MRYQSARMDQIPPYMFAELGKKKAAMIKAGIDVIDLGIGDPDLPTPAHIVDKLGEEARKPENLRYPNFSGHPEFRKAVAEFYMREYQVELDPETEVLALIGSKEGIAHLVPSMIDPGEIVLVPDPCYPPYRMAVLLAGGSFHNMPMKKETGFKPIFADIPEGVLAKTRLMFLNYPGNPTAASVDGSFFQEAVDFAKENRLVIAHDSAYNKVTFGDYKAPSILEAKGARDVAVEFGSLSKTYCMTGWRIGYVVGNKEVIRALAVYKNNTDTGQFTPIQLAAAHALRGDQTCIEDYNRVYFNRMKGMVGALREIGIDAEEPKATFFIWAPVPPGFSSAEFSAAVLEQAGVIVTPGSAFGPSGEGFFRVSLSVPSDRLEEAANRIKKQNKLRGDGRDKDVETLR